MSQWQDLVIFAGNFVFALALLPSFLPRRRPSVITCLITATVLWVYFGTFLSLGFHWSALGSLVTGAMWSALAVIAWQGQKVEVAA